MAIATCASAASACPCGAALGPVAAWTLPAERVALAAALSYQTELGSVDVRGRPWSNPAGVSSHRVLIDLAAAWRVAPSVELAALWTAAYSALSLPGASEASLAAGDLTLRARWEAAAPLRRAAPQVSAWAGLRAPTGSQGAGSLATVTGLGLGAWEPSLGAELRWALGAWTLLALTELGVRVAPSGPVLPGVRWMLGAAVAHQTTARWGWTAALTEVVEGPAREGGQWVEGSDTRRSLLTLGASARWSDSLRTTLSLGGDLPLPGLERGVTTQLRAGVTLVWTH